MPIDINDDDAVINDLAEMLDVDDDQLSFEEYARLPPRNDADVFFSPNQVRPNIEVRAVRVGRSSILLWVTNFSVFQELNVEFIRWLLRHKPAILGFDNPAKLIQAVDVGLLQKYVYSLVSQGDEAEILANTDVHKFWQMYLEVFDLKTLPKFEEVELTYVKEATIKKLQRQFSQIVAPYIYSDPPGPNVNQPVEARAFYMKYLVNNVGQKEAERLVVEGVGADEDAIVEALVFEQAYSPLSVNNKEYITRHGLRFIQVYGKPIEIYDLVTPIMI